MVSFMLINMMMELERWQEVKKILSIGIKKVIASQGEDLD